MNKNESAFNREHLLKKLNELSVWDVIIIGGGATGLGIALDAANRGYATLLLERADFAKGTSSRSTKLVHGGIRYLAQGNISLVYSALAERGILLQNAPHLVKKQCFIIPCYKKWNQINYLIGLKLYDWLSGRLSFGKSKYLNKRKVLGQLPNIKSKGLLGGIEYYDGQFDDARLAINLAQTCIEKGAVILNYFKVSNLIKSSEGKINGVIAEDVEQKKEYRLQAKVVINATGVFVDDILKMDEPQRPPLVRLSQGIHIVINQSFINSNSALLIPKTADGRVLFAVPWHQHLLAGTTDTPIQQHSMEPVATKEEVQFVLQSLKDYLSTSPKEKDVLSVFAGLRPLVASQKGIKSTKEISRDHKLVVNHSGLITITGGKWTTYRKMAEDTVNAAIKVGHLPPVPCSTKHLKIHGYSTNNFQDYLSVYGTDRENIEALVRENPLLGKQLIDGLPYIEAEVIWAVQYEMARTVEDVLARRLRLLFLDAQAAINAAPRVAELMREEFQYEESWKEVQLKNFLTVANKYLLQPSS